MMSLKNANSAKTLVLDPAATPQIPAIPKNVISSPLALLERASMRFSADPRPSSSMSLFQISQKKAHQATWAAAAQRFVVPRSKSEKLHEIIRTIPDFSQHMDKKDALNLAIALPKLSSALLTQQRCRREVAKMLKVDEAWLNKRSAAVEPEGHDPVYRRTTHWKNLYSDMTLNQSNAQRGSAAEAFFVYDTPLLRKLVPEIVTESLKNQLEATLFKSIISAMFPVAINSTLGISGNVLQAVACARWAILGLTLSDHQFLAIKPVLVFEFMKSYNDSVMAFTLRFVSPKNYRKGSIVICGLAALAAVSSSYAGLQQMKRTADMFKDVWFQHLNAVNANALKAMIETTRADEGSGFQAETDDSNESAS